MQGWRIAAKPLLAAACAGLALLVAPLAAMAADVQIIITSGTTWVVPTDWDSTHNTIEVIGAGSKADVIAGTPFGGGGGAYAKATNVFFTLGSTVSIQVGNPLGLRDTWVKDAGTVMAKGGSVPTGGQAAASVGATKFSGGNGQSSGGGGGAAGPHGNGNNAGAGGGGSGDAGFGGAGGSSAGSDGSNGAEYGSVGAGGGGGGGGGLSVCGIGGNYGGGSGADVGCANPIGTAGLIVITYQPRSRRGSAAAF